MASQRIVPALIAMGAGGIQVLSLGRDRQGLCSGPADIQLTECADDNEIIERAIGFNAPVIIATWPNTHLEYASAFIKGGLALAIEKPLAVTTTGIEGFARLFMELEQRGEGARAFCLGYYALEKALPLNMLFSAGENRALSLLEWAGECRPVAHEELVLLRDQLGAVVSLSVRILEGKVRSPMGPLLHWTEYNGSGGVLFDTFTHALQLAVVILGTSALDQLRWQDGWSAARLAQLNLEPHQTPAHRIVATARSTSFQIHLEAGKHTPEALCVREAKVDFEHGRAICDFDAQSLLIEVHGSTPRLLRFATSSGLGIRYGPQMALMAAAHHDGARAHDLRDTQLAALELLVSRREVGNFKY